MSDEVSGSGLNKLITEAVTLSENGLLIVDAHDRIVFCSPAMASYFGIAAPGAVTGMLVNDVLTWLHRNELGENADGRSLSDWLAHFQSSFRSLPFRSFEIEMFDGKWLLTTEQLLQGGAVMIQCSDITRLKTAESELLKSKLELEYLAMTDELTRLPSRRHFLSCLESEIQRAVRYDSPLSVAMIDLDFFKRVNDRFGHKGGDDVLRHFSALLLEQLRNCDVAGRLGGEEFAISFPETEIVDAFNVVERIRTALASESLDQLEPGFVYTFSCGLASSQHFEAAEGHQLLGVADQALYRAKNSGRNQTSLFTAQN